MQNRQCNGDPAVHFGGYLVSCSPDRILTVQLGSLLQAIHLTPTEHRIIQQFLQKSIQTDEDLFEASGVNGKVLQRHIENLRAKLRPSGLSISRLTGYGYLFYALDERVRNGG